MYVLYVLTGCLKCDIIHELLSALQTSCIYVYSIYTMSMADSRLAIAWYVAYQQDKAIIHTFALVAHWQSTQPRPLNVMGLTSHLDLMQLICVFVNNSLEKK